MTKANSHIQSQPDGQSALDLCRGRDGMTVPEGFFDGFGERLAASLPEQPWETKAPAIKPTFWQVVRPYVYMAAAFVGVWCMMSIFDKMRPADPLGDSPALMAALSDDQFVYDYFMDYADDGDEMAQSLNAADLPGWSDDETIPEAEF